ncbi:unnamed protein product [marine sediment metagenome]|uniref:DUF86 domain-containing protein n=1 Tax=marine sediment metagenome TaxID=412755 RepID=X0UQ67_9ZZZZ
MKQDEVFIRHILDEIDFLIDSSKGLEYEVLIKDETLKRAFVRSLEVIGEATKNISSEFRQKHPDIEWRELTGLRDKLVHRYFGVKWEIVWDVVKSKIPQLKERIEGVLEEMERG